MDARTRATTARRTGTVVWLAWLVGCAAPAPASGFAPASGSAPTQTLFEATSPPGRTIDDARAALPGYVFWDETRYGENDPGHPIPTTCAGVTRARCDVEIVIERGHVGGVVLRSPALEGPAGARVGSTHASLAGRLVDCHVGLGDAEGIFCDLDGYRNVGIELTVAGLYDTMPSSETPTSEQLARATIARIVWHPAAP